MTQQLRHTRNEVTVQVHRQRRLVGATTVAATPSKSRISRPLRKLSVPANALYKLSRSTLSKYRFLGRKETVLCHNLAFHRAETVVEDDPYVGSLSESNLKVPPIRQEHSVGLLETSAGPVNVWDGSAGGIWHSPGGALAWSTEANMLRTDVRPVLL